MKCLLIYTPFAMRGKIEKKIPFIVEELKQKYSVEVAKTAHKKHATELAKKACGVFDVVVIAGGDGLVNEVLNGVVGEKDIPKLMLLPLGTVNDLARSFGIPKALKKSLKIGLNGTYHNIDFFKIKSKSQNFYANYVVCAGKHTESTYNTKQKSKTSFGWFAYFVQAVKGLFSCTKHNFEIEVNNKKLPHSFLFAMFINSHSVAGFKLNKKAKLNDGFFEMVLIKNRKGFSNFIARYIVLVKLFLFGLNSLRKSKIAVVMSIKNVKFKNLSNSNLNIDGECSGNEDEYEISLSNTQNTWIF